MKKTKGHYPYKQALKFEGLKIVGIAEKNEKEIINNLVIEEIIKRNPDLKDYDFYSKTKNIKIYFCEKLPRFRGFDGAAIFKKIFVPINMYNYIKENKISAIKSSAEFKIIFHEFIHFVQGSSLLTRFYKSHDLVGLIEGATEKETIETLGNNTSTFTGKCQYNFKTTAVPYVMGISIMQQLEVLYGRELVKQFTFFKDTKLIDYMIKDLGKDFTFLLIDSCKKYINPSKKTISFESLQNKLMHNYFTNKIKTISYLEEAKVLLNKLKELGTARVKLLDSTEYENFYNKIYFELKEKYDELDSTNNKYQEPVYNNTSTLEDRYKKMKDSVETDVFNNIPSSIIENNRKKLDTNAIFNAFDNLDFHNYKIYEYVDSNMFCNISVINKSFVQAKIIITNDKGVDNAVNFSGKIENGLCHLNKDDINMIYDFNNNKVVINEKEFSVQDKTEEYLNKKNLYNIFKEVIKENYKYNKKKELPNYDEYEEVVHRHK